MFEVTLIIEGDVIDTQRYPTEEQAKAYEDGVAAMPCYDAHHVEIKEVNHSENYR